MVVDNGNTLPISSPGTLNFQIFTRPLYLNNIPIVSNLTANLLSIAKFVKDNFCLIEFNMFGDVVKEFITKIPLLKGLISNNLHHMKIPINVRNLIVFTACPASSDLWHQRLGHPCAQTLSRFFKSKNADKCISCLQRKNCHLPFSHSLC